MVESRLEPLDRLDSLPGCSSTSPHSSCSSPQFPELVQGSPPIAVQSGFLSHSAGHRDNSLEPSCGNARGEMSESSPPDHYKIGSNQRSRSQQPLGQWPAQASSPSGGFPASSSSSENDRGLSPASLQAPAMSYAPGNVQYRPGFFSQYPLSAHATPIPMAHGPPPYASYHPIAADNNMISQTMHPNYPSMLQPPPGTVFPYQQHSPDGNSSTHLAPFPAQQGTQLYPPPHIPSASQASPQIPATSVSSNAMSPSYIGSSPFHSLQYSSPMTPSPYSYPPHSFSTPVYHSQYPPHPTLHRYPSSGEAEPQGAWYYLHHGPPQSPYESGPSYQARFPTPYATLGQQEAEIPVFDQHRPPPPPHVGSSSPKVRQESHGTKPGIYNPTPTPASSSSGFNKAPDKPIVRRSYHPNPPAHRSEWVMWVGNVPSDATHDELWRFFNQQPPERPAGSPESTGVLSIFLISRSSCAFVNYKSDFFLQEAVSRFNGVPLRSSDSRCPRLVCRMRRLDDDLKAGVGGQRGMGMHTKWVKERKGKQREVDGGIDTSDVSLSSSSVRLSERMAAAISTISMTSDENPQDKERRQSHAKQSSSSGSFTSTNSSVLARHFPKRYFILKSLTQHDLDLSVETGLWATQRHNEEILDQAFRTSKEVYLIFGANKTGEFYGYARMAGPVGRGQQRVSWASRSPPSSASRSAQSPIASRGKSETFFQPNDLRFVETSPLPLNTVTPQSEGIVRHTAPAMLGEPYQHPRVTPVEKFSLDQGLSRVKGFHLDESAPQRAMRDQESPLNVKPQVRGVRTGSSLESVDETEEKEIKVEGEGRQPEELKRIDGWGDSFPLEWLSTLRLPFHRTRDLRNPWNHDKEIKVSRDGIELEPSVGERLLEEWQKLAKEVQAQASSSTVEEPLGDFAGVSKSVELKGLWSAKIDRGDKKAGRISSK